MGGGRALGNVCGGGGGASKYFFRGRNSHQVYRCLHIGCRTAALPCAWPKSQATMEEPATHVSCTEWGACEGLPANGPLAHLFDKCTPSSRAQSRPPRPAFIVALLTTMNHGKIKQAPEMHGDFQ